MGVRCEGSVYGTGVRCEEEWGCGRVQDGSKVLECGVKKVRWKCEVHGMKMQTDWSIWPLLDERIAQRHSERGLLKNLALFLLVLFMLLPWWAQHCASLKFKTV